MKYVELKNIKVHHGLSEETFCFEASVYLKGKRIGTIGNRGCGGANEIGISSSDEKLIENWLKENLTYDDYDGNQTPMHFEMWSFLEVEKHLQEKELKRMLNNNVLVMDDTCKHGESFNWTFKTYKRPKQEVIDGVTNMLKSSKQYQNPRVLNNMTFKKAYESFYVSQL